MKIVLQCRIHTLTAFSIAIAAGIHLSCTGAAAQSAAKFNNDFRAGFAVENGFSLRDAGLSRNGSLETTGHNAFTSVTAAIATPERVLLGTSNRGVYASRDGGKTWGRDTVMEIPMLTDAANQRQVYAFDSTGTLLTHKHNILIRTDNAPQHWQMVKTDKGRSVIFTAIHIGKKFIYLGTSVNGLAVAPYSEAALKAAIAGKTQLSLTFQNKNAGLPGKPHSKSHFMYEEVQAIRELPDGSLLALTGPRPALQLRKKAGEPFQPIAVNGLSDQLDECPSLSAVSPEKIVVSCRRGVWSGSALNPHWVFTPQSAIVSDKVTGYAFVDSDGNQLSFTAFHSNLTPEKKQRQQNAVGQRIMYASAYTWNKRQAQVLAELKNDFWTGLVIDGKDDNGIIRFDSEIPLAHAVKAVRPLYKMAEVAQKLHAMKKRLIVRLVIFKDPKLFEREGYAIMDAGGGKWVGTPKERWIDPYNPNLLTEYYAPMMKELTERGVDEIQLDYIRFPSDGAVGRCRFSHKKADYYYSEALENFLTGVRQSTHLPMGADIYGYNGMYRVPGSIGQDLEVYGRVLDVIAPMHYSSHFGDDYMRHLPREERTYQLLYLALSRGSFFAHGEFIIRPYIQAFSMKDGLWGYGKKYFADQIKGSAEGGGDGFMFWGKLDDMMLVRKTQTQ
ncbi:MAG: putative glycoside hydrolase [Turneriella sp.]